MKRIAVSLLVVAFASLNANAGTVNFGPAQEVDILAADKTVTFSIEMVASDLTEMVSGRFIFESADLFLAPPGGAVIGQFDVDPQRGALQLGGMIGGFGIPFPGTEPVGFLGNFTAAFVDLNGTTSGSGVNLELLNDLGDVANRPALDLAPGTSFLIGHLTVDAAGLDEGTYTVEVSGGSSVLANLTGTEEMFGAGTVRVTPEPATLALLGIGGLIALRRRHTR